MNEPSQPSPLQQTETRVDIIQSGPFWNKRGLYYRYILTNTLYYR